MAVRLRIIVGGKEVVIARKESPFVHIRYILIRIRNGLVGIEQTIPMVAEVEKEIAAKLGIGFVQLRQEIIREFENEEQLRAFCATLLKTLRDVFDLTAEIEREKTIDRKTLGEYISRLKEISARAYALVIEKSELTKIEFLQEKYENYFATKGKTYEEIKHLIVRYVNALRQQKSQLALAVNALVELDELLRHYK